MLLPLSPLLKQHRLCITKASSSSQRCSFASGDFKRKRRLIIESPSEAAAQHVKQTTVFDPFPTFEAPERFGYEADRDGHWYVGHMMRTKQALPAWANRVDVVIEIRDARVPLTSAQTELNSNLRQAGIRKLPRLVVLNKCDLVTPSMARRAQEMIEAHSNAKCVLATSVLKKGVVKIKEFMLSEREIRFQSLGIYGLIVGLPNTGKSTTINALKRLALLASKTRYDCRGMMAGVSRAQARVTMSPGTTELIRAYQLSHNPTLYLVDTPGVTFHKDKTNPERNLKLAAVGTFPDHIFGELYIADYILWRLNNARLFQYVNVCGLSGGPTNDIRSV
ncbi:Mitochondrial GTPase, partial [Perkinsus olseni]